MIFVTIVCAEALEESVDLRVAAARAGCWCSAGTRQAMREQIRLVAPLGAGSVLYKLNDFGKVVVANQMGPVPLAIYTTAAYQVPLVNIVQGALAGCDLSRHGQALAARSARRACCCGSARRC